MTGQDTYLDGKVESVRNPEGQWINVQGFREAGLHYSKHGYYVADPWGSPAWLDYWIEQRRRCIEGYTLGGAKITGDHYFYLNFCPIRLVEDAKSRNIRKTVNFPHFWDGDYNYFWVREIAKKGLLDSLPDDETREYILELDSIAQAVELKKLFESLHLEVKIAPDYLRGGYNLIVGKSRRKGYSYKSAAIATCNYFTKPQSLTIFNAYEKKFLYPKGLFSMSVDYINFINMNTGWLMPSDEVNKVDHIKASYITYKNGTKISQGFKSEILATTCKDNADANRGKDAEDIFVEESGAFGTPGLLKDLYAASEDCVKAGSLKTGMITLFGTSGDMEGGTADYADMHSRPLAFELLPFKNVWDDGMEDTQCGFFHPVHWNMEGFYDKQGNSDREAAKNLELESRKKLIANGASSIEIQKRMQEKPLGPSEAFASVSVNTFPVVELKKQLFKVRANNLQNIKGTPVKFKRTSSGVEAEPILNGKVLPITSYYNLPDDVRGVPMIYEAPVANAPKGLYSIGYDPIRQEEGSSLAGILVYKNVLIGSMTHSIIVAEYIGRLATPNDIDKMAEYFADYYNTTIMHENDVIGVRNYFRRIKRLSLLAVQPDLVISNNVKNSKVARKYGCHMTPQLKSAGERYILEWLLTVLDYDEFGEPITVIDTIYSIRLLEELIAYNDKGNFDLVSALIMCMMQIKEKALGHEYDKEKTDDKKLAKMDELFGFDE